MNSAKVSKLLVGIALSWSSIAYSAEMSVFEGVYRSSGVNHDPKSAPCPSEVRLQLGEDYAGQLIMLLRDQRSGQLIAKISGSSIREADSYQNNQGIIEFQNAAFGFSGTLLLAIVPGGRGTTKNHIEMQFSRSSYYDPSVGRNRHLNCTYTIFTPAQ